MFRINRHILLRFVAIFLPLAAVTALIVLALYWSQIASQHATWRAGERAAVARGQQIIGADLRAIVADVMILSRLAAVQKMLDTSTPEQRRTLASEYRLFLEQRRIYDQARFLDARGMEIVRVNFRDGRGEIVAREKLQDKRDRYYFREATRLRSGELYVSPFDLNVEEGGIELPIKPTIRFATPVHDDAGQLRGVVILNYLGSNLLDKLRASSSGSLGEIGLVNGDGYWLLGPSPDREWGFMYGDRQEVSFAQDHPYAWREVSAAASGQAETPAGLWTFETVDPLARIRAELDASPSFAASRPEAARPYRWSIVSLVNATVMQEQTTQLRLGFWRLFAALLLVLFVVSWLWARVLLAHRLARLQLLQSERLSAIGEAMTALTHESRNALQRSQAGLDMLVKRVADRPEAVQLLGEVQAAQYFLRDQYESVRDYAAPINLHKQEVDLRSVLGEAWGHLGKERQGRAIELVDRGDAVNARAWADKRAISQVIRNLLQNAIEASANVSRIDVTFGDDRLGHRPALRIAVRDDGPGMSREQRERAFEPFFTTKPRGTGLGMAICRRIVEAHGGQIVVVDGSVPGTEVIVTLPRFRA